MMVDYGTYEVPAGAERVEIPHALGRAPNIVTVEGLPEGSKVFTLVDRALLLVLPPGHEGCEVEWSVGYEAPAEPERDEDEGTEW
jgi:hypothetical protein